MGINYTAHALLGCEVTGKLYKTVERPSCTHKNPKGNVFCHTCGKKIGLAEAEEPIDGFDEDNNVIGDLVVVHGGFAGGGTSEMRAFVGVAVDADYYRDKYAKRLPIGSAVHEIAAAHKRILEPLGLWDPNTFGLWAILSCG